MRWRSISDCTSPERFTSSAKVASHAAPSVRARGVLASRAATLILQDFLNQRFPSE